MKKIIRILSASIIFFLLIMVSPSCRRASDHGKLDGFWQIQSIEYSDGSPTVYPQTRMIAIQLELLQLDNTMPSPALTGVLDYHKGDSQIGVDFRYGPTDEQLAFYGFAPDPALSQGNSKYCVLQIEHLSNKKLILRSPIALVTCRKY